ncbi:S8 family serine peptidase [Fontisphaera persica]|uniref:S8 family peptidase n=1 Tax=Fontisphaera persica TaxID=2974023 RepID=UPI0024BF63F1|nr:S8 family serine peptidase [Fontisphaera persica]WCJ60037.1 S8 family serine peptidase [Fontisphaera persica]
MSGRRMTSASGLGWWIICCLGLIALGAAVESQAAQRLSHDRAQGTFTAIFQRQELTNVLEELTRVTGWQVYLEPETRHTVSVAFTNQPTGEALRRLLGPLSYALIPQPGQPPRLMVFRTSVEEATQLIVARQKGPEDGGRIPDELIVVLKPGQSVDEIAKALGARVVASSAGLNAYRLKFDSEESAQAARERLAQNPAVASVDSNYWVQRPGDIDVLRAGAGRPLVLSAKPIGDGNPIVVGLIDTAVQSLGKDLDPLILKGISVAGEAALPADVLTHGTAMAYDILTGLSQLLPPGQATSVRLVWVDVYGNNPQTTTFDVGVGTFTAIQAGANIINYSLGGEGESAFLRDILQSARQKGILPIAAAGNVPGTVPVYPAAFPEAIAITAGDRQGQIAPWANRGEFVDGVAPGSSLVPFAGRTFFVSGTSTATAFASGYAAALADKTGKPALEVERLLLELIGVKKP